MEQVEPLPSERAGYFREAPPSLIFLYASAAERGTQGVVAVFFAGARRAAVHLVRPYGGPPALARVLRAAPAYAFDAPQAFGSVELALAAAADFIATHKQTHAEASVVVCQLGVPEPAAGRAAARVGELYPQTSMEAHAEDATYPALAWEEAAVRRALLRAEQAPAWLAQQLELARFAGVPLCNLGTDARLVGCVLCVFVLPSGSLRELSFCLFSVCLSVSILSVCMSVGPARRLCS